MALLALGVLAGAARAASSSSVATLFPDATRVASDYPDDVERLAALRVLFAALGEASKGTQAPGAYQKQSAYHRAAGEIQDGYERQGRASPAFKAFDERAGRLLTDRRFGESVLARYGLAGATSRRAQAAPETPLFPEGGGTPSDAAIAAAFRRAAGVWLPGVLGMLALAWVIVRSSGTAIVARASRATGPGYVPPVPESVRVVSVPGRTFEVDIESGEVVRKETTTELNVTTTTTGGQVHVQGDWVYTTPVQTQTSVSSVQKDVLWVRSPDGREAPWTFWGGTFQVREGQLVSRVGRPLRDGRHGLLLAYNHTTGQMERLAGAHEALRPRFLWAWLLTALAGSVPGVVGLGVMFHRLGGLPRAPLAIQLATLWIQSMVVSVPVAALLVLLVFRAVLARRNARFMAGYVPELQRHLAAATPLLQKSLAARRP